METLQIGPWILKYDKEATRQAYSQVEIGDPERCAYEHCLNFVAVREEVYPEEAKKVFAQLGIDYTKEIEVAHTHRIKPRWHSYLGWFYIISALECTNEHSGMVPVTKRFSWAFNPTISYEIGGFPEKSSIELYFTAEVPWVIEGKEPE